MDLSQKICVRLTVRILFPKFFFSIGKKETSRAASQELGCHFSLEFGAVHKHVDYYKTRSSIHHLLCLSLSVCVCVCVQSVSKGYAHLASCDIQSKRRDDDYNHISYQHNNPLYTLSMGSFSVIHLQHILSSARQFSCLCDLDSSFT